MTFVDTLRLATGFSFPFYNKKGFELQHNLEKSWPSAAHVPYI